MTKFNFLFGLKICERILKQTDNLSRALQKSSLSAAEAQYIASLTVSTLAKIRTDQSFQFFFTLVKKLGQDLGVGELVLPRKRKVPRHLDDGHASSCFFSETVEDWYQSAYFEALELVIEGIKDRFDQPGYAIYLSLEELLVKGEEFGDQKRHVCEFYNKIDGTQLNMQLSLATYFQSNNIPVSLEECFSDAKSFYSEILYVL